MLLSLNWLKKYIDLDENLTINELENALTMIGQEVEKIEIKGENLKKVFTAKIVEYEKMPDSDHLTICKVDNGSQILQVICGAPNHKKGDIVAMANIGAKLSEEFEIKKGKIRGYESNGMLCSEVELGIGEDDKGIIIFPEDTPLGLSLDKYLGINDVVFELEITPNRPDCLSHIGIARELSAYYNKSLNIPKIDKINVNDGNDIKISIDGNSSNRYLARIIRNVEIKESPKWLKAALNSVGIRSINNIVDISNYVMLETNQPNHMFDLSKLEGNEINVEIAKKEEVFVTLDEKERNIEKEDILIKDSKKTIALAGVMGGLNSEIDNTTKDILIEVAHFDNISIRKTSRRLALFSESSYRFERRVDEENMPYVMDRLTNLILESCKNAKAEKIYDNYKNKQKELICDVDLNRMERFIGKKIEKDVILNILTRLGISVKDNGEILNCIAPSYRQDLVNQFDYFEEIIRLVGFDNIENVMPKVEINKNRIFDSTRFITDIKLLTSKLGLREVINYSFIPKDSLSKIKFEIDESKDFIEILNPITEDFAILRPTLMYSLLKNVKDNINRSIQDIRFFEVSKVFEKNSKEEENLDDKSVYLDNRKILENNILSIVLAGVKNKTLWDPKPNSYDFYDIKGIIEDLFEKIGFKKYQIKRSKNPSLHPGQSVDIYVGKELVGYYGTMHPDVLENMDLEKIEVVYANIYLDRIKKYINFKFNYQPISKYQSVNRDIAVVVKEDILVGDLISLIQKQDKLIKDVQIFDIYQGIGVEDGYKSIAISMLISDNNKTLEESEIVSIVNKVLEKLEKEYDARLRS